MRCSNCNKFVGYEEPHEVEADGDPEINDGEITATYRVVLKCAECSEELKDASIEITETVDGFEKENHDEDKPEHEITLEVDEPEADVKIEGKGRGTKTSYGLTATYHVSCSCGATAQGILTGHERASYMNEL